MLFSIISAILLILSFPNFNFSLLVFIGFIPLFFAIENKSPQKAFLISYICGFIFYLGTLYWLYHVTVIGLIILCLYLALYFGGFGWILVGGGFKPRPYIFLIPFVWIFLEYIQAHLFTGFGWALLGYSQYRNIPLIQIADFSGVYGVSFVIMMVNVSVYMSLRGAKRRSNPCRKIVSSAFGLLAMTSLILIASCIYGFYRLNERHNTTSAKISVIQGNIPQELKWDPDAHDMIIEKYLALTKMSALDNPDLVIWPETSFPGFFETDKDMTDKVLDLAKEIRVPILIGANTEGPSPFPLPRGERGKVRGYFNSAVLISSQGKVIDKYDKIHLVPFGEYVPFSGRFPALHKLVLGELGEFTPGQDFKTFDFKPRITNDERRTTNDETRFAVLICFEDIFPGIAKRFVKDGAKFLVVITNDAWYGKSGAAYQHAACSVFRAIENRVPIVRCANTGYSCFIDSKGRIYDSVEDKNTHLFVTGYKTSTLLIK